MERVQQAVSFTCICISIFGVHIHERWGVAVLPVSGVISEGITGEFQPSACLNSCLSLRFDTLHLSVYLVLFTSFNVCEMHGAHNISNVKI